MPAKFVGDLWLEIGFGGGEHLAAQIAGHPSVAFLGVEPFVNGMAALLAKLPDNAHERVRLYDGDARALLAGLPQACLARAFLLFPDPWPKKRHHKRRFVGQDTLGLCIACWRLAGLYALPAIFPIILIGR